MTAILAGIGADARYAVRAMRRRPGFATVASLAIAIGIAANGILFSLVQAVLLKSLPFRDLDRLVMIWQQDLPHDRDRITLSLREYREYQERARAFEQIAAVRPTAFDASVAGAPATLEGARASVNLLSTLGVAPAVGRDFAADEGTPGRDRVALLSHGAWLRYFAGDARVIGKPMVLDESAAAAPDAAGSGPGVYVVVGVLPPDFRIFYTSAEILTPLTLEAANAARPQRGLRLIGRIKPDVSLAQAGEEINAIDRRLATEAPEPSRGVAVALIPLREEDVGDVRPTLLALLVGATLVLLIVCANVSNMLLARAVERDREAAIRLALGSGTGRLVRQLLTEGLLLGALGAALGLWIAGWGARAIVRWGPESIPRLAAVTLDPAVVGATAVLSLLAGLACALAPAWRVTRQDVRQSLAARGGSRGTGSVLRQALVVSEVAVAVVVLAGAGAVAKSFIELSRAPLGFEAQRVLTFRVAPPRSRYARPERRLALYRDVLDRIRRAPGVIAAGAVNILPITDSDLSVSFAAEGGPSDPEQPSVAKLRIASPGYFRALSIPLLQGRDFEEADPGRGVAIASEALARALGNGGDALARRLELRIAGAQRSVAIVGVVGDVRQFRDTPPRPTLYLAAYGQPSMTLAIRTAGDPAGAVATLRKTLLAPDPELAAYDVRTMTDRVDRAGQFTQGRFRAIVASAFGVTALLLAALGVHGVLRYSVSERAAEFGVRLAVGARPTQILSMVVAQALRQVSIGIALGSLSTIALMRVLASLLDGIRASEPLLLLSTCLLLLSVAVFAAYLPARRAARTDALTALRYE